MRHKLLHIIKDIMFWHYPPLHIKNITKVLFILVLSLFSVWLWKPYLISFLINYTYLIVQVLNTDHQRHLDRQVELAQVEWRLFQMQSRFMQDWCKENDHSRNDLTWLSITVNDEFIIPTIVLGYVLSKLSCQKNMLVFVSGNEVSTEGIQALQKVGFKVDVVESMDCNWMERRMGLPETNTGIKGTHTRFHAWNYTQFKTIVYLDADYLPLMNIDELFHMDTDFGAVYCAGPGLVDPCFNAGLMVFKPSEKIHREIMQLWKELSYDSCTNDQRLLWHYFADQGRWLPLPYSYNVRRAVYRPLKAFHYAGVRYPKPWKDPERPTKQEAMDFEGPLHSVPDISKLWWKLLYEAIDKHDLHDWWKKSKFYKAPSKKNKV